MHNKASLHSPYYYSRLTLSLGDMETKTFQKDHTRQSDSQNLIFAMLLESITIAFLHYLVITIY